MGLYSPYYAQTRAAILALESLPSLDRVYQMVIQDERVRPATQPLESSVSEVVGFSVRTDAGRGRGRGDRPDRSSLVCSHCKKSGHDIATCVKLIGYPAHWHDFGGRGRCRASGRGRGPPAAARANAAASSSSLDSSASGSVAPSSLFTADQWKVLAGMFGNVKLPENRLTSKFDSHSWIIDTRASHHVTGIFSWLFDVHDIPSCPVGLPNGNSVITHQEGSVRLSSTLTITLVLYVPQLTCNLLSISQLRDSLH